MRQHGTESFEDRRCWEMNTVAAEGAPNQLHGVGMLSVLDSLTARPFETTTGRPYSYKWVAFKVPFNAVVSVATAVPRCQQLEPKSLPDECDVQPACPNIAPASSTIRSHRLIFQTVDGSCCQCSWAGSEKTG